MTYSSSSRTKKNSTAVGRGAKQSMRRAQRIAIVALVGALIGGTSSLVATAHAASADKAGGACKTAGAKTMISGKSYTCMDTSTNKAKKKLVWNPTPTLGAAGGNMGGANGKGGGANGKGGLNGPGGFGPDGDNDHGANNPAIQKAFAAYNACLVKNGGTAMTFGPGAPGTKPGAQPTPGVRPTPSAAQQKAEKACASLRPKIGGPGGRGEGHEGHEGHEGGPDDDNNGGMNGKAAPLVAPSKSPSA